MEDRLKPNGTARPGPAVIALLLIGAITAAWWGLALWPAGATPPEWLVRTRAACFGARSGGLPDSGGWLVLIGQPLGMIGFLLVGWGDSLRLELGNLAGRRTWRAAGAALLLVALLGAGAAARRVTAGSDRPAEPESGAWNRVDAALPAVELVDQHGRSVSLPDLPGPVLLTFAYGHCPTVCPTTLRDLQAARSREALTVRIVVVTLDPWRDTPERLGSLAVAWGAREASGDLVLSGEPPLVARALTELRIAYRRDSVTGDIDHIATVLGLDARGRVRWRRDGTGPLTGRLSEVVR